MTALSVLFAPDYRAGVPYQSLLAEGLAACGVEVEFVSGYRRGFPLTRAVRASGAGLLHLHWPEHYFLSRNPAWAAIRKLRYPIDLALTRRQVPIVVTAHDLYPHNRDHELLVAASMRRTLRAASVVIVHGQAAAEELARVFGIPPDRCHVVSHGDLSVRMGPPADRSAARAALGLGDAPVCLMFGTVEPYKGVEPVIAHWRSASPAADLIIVGKAISPEYAKGLETAARGLDRVQFVFGFQSDECLRLWLSAADAVVFNYRSVFTSGAACLARSYGIPVLLPRRLTSIELAEPDARVFRFNNFADDFGMKLAAALATGRDYPAAAQWRAETSWDRVARETAEVYRSVLGRWEPVSS